MNKINKRGLLEDMVLIIFSLLVVLGFLIGGMIYSVGVGEGIPFKIQTLNYDLYGFVVETRATPPSSISVSNYISRYPNSSLSLFPTFDQVNLMTQGTVIKGKQKKWVPSRINVPLNTEAKEFKGKTFENEVQVTAIGSDFDVSELKSFDKVDLLCESYISGKYDSYLGDSGSSKSDNESFVYLIGGDEEFTQNVVENVFKSLGGERSGSNIKMAQNTMEKGKMFAKIQLVDSETSPERVFITNPSLANKKMACLLRKDIPDLEIAQKERGIASPSEVAFVLEIKKGSQHVGDITDAILRYLDG